MDEPSPQGVSETGRLPLNERDRFTLEYEAVNGYILHYSNVRSALTSFLVTVALASFAAYYNIDEMRVDHQRPWSGIAGPHVLWIAAYIFLVAAVASSLKFSYLTELANEYSKRLWWWGVEGRSDYPGGFRGKTWKEPVCSRRLPAGKFEMLALDSRKRRRIIISRMGKDLMNWLLIGGAIAIGSVFWLSEHVGDRGPG